ncbi:hypothetical protein [uncultured Rikenella sp.]|uniref:hypothetical protein n=1 Tax=uncultured Rikenella sp. TaxID=368003 RepID=UPI002605BC23|nr:hypothetical protein [uncultured Rikenella sp.]
MSLTIEKIQIEAKIAALEKENNMAIITADMAITNLRQEASPLLELEQIDLEKIDAAVAALHATVNRKKDNDKEIERLKKML